MKDNRFSDRREQLMVITENDLDQNPYAAPQTTATAAISHRAAPRCRWAYVDMAYRVGFLIGCTAVCVVIGLVILQIQSWLSGIFIAMFAIPCTVAACFALGLIAVALDWFLQAIYLRTPPEGKHP